MHLCFVFTTPLYSSKQDASVVLLVSNHQLITEKLYPTLLILFWGPRLLAKITSHLSVHRQLLGQVLEQGNPGSHWVNVLSWRSVFVLSCQRTTLNPGSYLPSSPQARWLTETSTSPSPGDTSSYDKWLLNKSPCLRHKTTALKNGQSTWLFSHLLNSSVNLSLSKPWYYNGCATDSTMKAWQSPSCPPCSVLWLDWLLSLPVPPVIFLTAHCDAEQLCLTLCQSGTCNILAKQFSLLGT